MADKKLPFHVVFASGEDPQYPASELNVHSSKSKGWTSPRFCVYPQELGFEIDADGALLTQIQVLSHQFKIAKRIEIYVGFGPDYLHAEFKRLGYMSLESNERSEFKARELKSVYVSSDVQFVRLLIHECYSNPHNVSKQVCVVAVNFKGQVGGGNSVSLPPVAGRRAAPGPHSKGPGVHDLSLDMRMDPETAATIRQVSDMKEKAVADEDYEMAKALKVVESDLLKMGSEIARLIEMKTQAVENEDYDRARVIRDDINRVRSSIHQRIAAAGLGGGGRGSASMRSVPRGPPVDPYDMDPTRRMPGGRGPPTDEPIRAGGHYRSADAPYDGHERQLPPALLAADDANDLDQTIGHRAEPSPDAFARAPAKRGGDMQRTFPDERPIQPAKQEKAFPGDAGAPAAAVQASTEGEYDEGDAFGSGGGGGSGDTVDVEELAGVENVASLPAPAQLKPAQAKEFVSAIGVFGEYILRCFHSTQWALREAALKKIEVDLGSHAASTSDLLSAGCQMLGYVFNKEKNAQVIMVARDLLPKLLAECSDVRKADVISALDSVLTGLIDKLGETNTRIRDAAIDSLMHLADNEATGPAVVAAAVLKKLTAKQVTAWRPIKTRLEVAYMLVHGFGMTASGPLSETSILEFLSSANGYSHPNGEVREAAKALIVLLHSLKGDSIEKHLTGVLRPQQLREYQAAFEKGAPADPPTLVKDKSTPAAPAAPAPTAKKAAAPAKSVPAPPPAKSAGKGGKPAAAKPPPPQEEDEGEDEGICQFCEGCGPGATEQELDLHYWQECPMLIGCSQCKQIIEIATLTDHLLSECDFRSKFRQCPRCKDAIIDKEFDAHVAAKACAPPGAGKVRCPLCRSQIPSDPEAWMVHLIDEGCPANPRTAT